MDYCRWKGLHGHRWRVRGRAFSQGKLKGLRLNLELDRVRRQSAAASGFLLRKRLRFGILRIPPRDRNEHGIVMATEIPWEFLSILV